MAINEFLPTSPVPHDINLVDTELPFTAFGQYGQGNMDVRVFEQDIYWVNINGEPFYLEEMSTTYLENVKNFIFDGMEHFHFSVIRQALIDCFLSNDFTRADKLALGTNEGLRTSAEWLDETPLMIKIFKLLEQRYSLPAENL